MKTTLPPLQVLPEPITLVLILSRPPATEAELAAIVDQARRHVHVAIETKKPDVRPAHVQPLEGHAMQITFDGPLDVPKPEWAQ